MGCDLACQPRSAWDVLFGQRHNRRLADIPVTVGDLLVTVLILAAAGYLFHAFSRAAFSNAYAGLFFKVFLILAALLVVGWVFDSLLGYLHFGIVLAGIALCFVLGKVLEHLADR